MLDVAGALGEVGDFGGGVGVLENFMCEAVDGHAVAVLVIRCRGRGRCEF